MATTGAPSRRGRQRDPEVTARVLAAARELLLEHGAATVTAEGIAARAGVSKGTIYRWWPNAASVVMDAFLNGVQPVLVFPNTGSVRDDLRLQLRAVFALFRSPTGRVIADLVADAQRQPHLAAALREHYLAPRRAAAKAVLQQGITRHEIRPDLDLDAALDLLYGAAYYRLLLQHSSLDDQQADVLVDHVLPAWKS